MSMERSCRPAHRRWQDVVPDGSGAKLLRLPLRARARPCLRTRPPHAASRAETNPFHHLSTQLSAMPPQRVKKQPASRSNASLDSDVVASFPDPPANTTSAAATPSAVTPDGIAHSKRTVNITEQQKQVLMDNLQLESMGPCSDGG